MPFPYHILDVFTGTALAGNPLAIVLDADGMPTDRRQGIAREFNLSETVFVSEPRDPINTARIHIHTPARELPFAGHPTVGTAALLASLRAPEMIARQDLTVVLEEPIGLVECVVRGFKGRLQASFTLPRLPECLDAKPRLDGIAETLGLADDAIGFGDHRPGVYSAGVPFLCLPLREGAIGRVHGAGLAGHDLPGGALGVFLYGRDVASSSSVYRARMFVTDVGVGEDPATGSAVAALAGAIMDFDRPGGGDHALVVEQGFEMGRPSLITLGLTVEDGALTAATIGGGVVRVAEGRLHV